MIEEVIKIDTGEGAKSVKELRQELKDLKDQLLSAKSGSEEYSKTLVKAANIQKELKDQMHQINNSAMDFGQKIGNATKAMAGMTGAVSAATGAMSLFGIENEEAAQKITATMTSLMGITQGLQAVDSGVKAFKALTVAINASTVATKALKVAIATTGIGALVVLLATVIVKWSEWTQATKEENEALARTDALVNNLNDDLKAKERTMDYVLESMRIEGQLESEIQVEKQKHIKSLIDLANAQARQIELTKEQIKDDEKLAEVDKNLADIYRTISHYTDMLTKSRYDEQLALKRESKEAEKTASDAAEKARQQAVNLAKFEKDMALIKLQDSDKYSQKEYEIYMTYFNKMFKIYKKDSQEYRNLLLEKAKFDDQWESHNEDIIKNFKDSLKTERELLDERYSELVKAAKDNSQDLLLIKKWYDGEVKRLEEEGNKENIELLKKFIDEYDKTELDRLNERRKKLEEAAKDDAETLLKIQTWYNEERQKMIDQSLSADYETNPEDDLNTKLEKLELDKELAIKAAEEEGLETTAIVKYYEEQKTKIIQAESDKQKKIWRARLRAYQNMATGMGNILGSLSELMGEGTKAQKGMLVAQTMMEMFAGILSAIATAQQLGPPYGPIIGAINAAAVAAAGAVEIANIQKVNPDGETSGGGSYVPSISIPSAVAGSNDFTQTVDGAMTETAITDTKVYVLENEITDTQKKVEVNEARATY